MSDKPKCFEDAVREIANECIELLIKKQIDYGHSNIMSWGELGLLVRTDDKKARLNNLYKRKVNPENEPVEDSWRDLANYGIIALMLRRGTFTLPLKRDLELPREQLPS